jgi:hypothetical protein
MFVVGANAACAAAPAPASLGAPASLTQDDGNAISPQVAVNTRGDAVAVWYVFTSTTAIVQSSWRSAGGSWSEPVDITPSNGALYVTDVDVALTDRGEAIAVWTGAAGAGLEDTVIQTAARSRDGDWSASSDIARTVGTALGVRVAATRSGAAVAAWSRSAFGVTKVEAASRNSDGGWSTPVALNAPTTNAAQLDVGIDDHGDAVAVWTIFTSPGSQVQTATRAAGGAWSAPRDLSGPGMAPWVDLAVSRSGAATAVWNREDTSSGPVVVAADRDRTGNWSSAADIGPGALPQVAVGDRSRAVIVWRELPTGVETVTRLTDAGWSAPVELDAAGTYNAVAMSAKGVAVVVWAGEGAIRAATTGGDGVWSAPALLAASSADSVLDSPEVSISDGGDAAAVWRRWTPYSVGVIEAAASP